MDPVISSFSEPCFEEFISHINDPRVQGRCLHRLSDVMVIGFCAVLCGAEGFTEIEEWALVKEDWLREFLELPNGIPSHDTFLRVFSLVDPREFEAAFMGWAQSVAQRRHEHISLDGKSVAYANDQGRQNFPVHLVNVYAHDAGVFLGQLKALNPGAGEVAAVKDCLDFFDLKGCLISVDAGNTYPSVARNILEKGADYLFPIKGNQKQLREDIKQEFRERVESAGSVQSLEENHSRIDRRSARVLMFRSSEHLPKVKSIIEITREREQKVRRRQEEKPCIVNTHYYASSRRLSAINALFLVQQHWKIENSLHWVLDVAMLEDQCRVRAMIAAENLSLIRKLATNIVKKDTTPRRSVRRKLKMAAWDQAYLENLLFS